MAPTPLEGLQAQHAENFGWALACCAWRRDMAEDVLQEAYLRVLDGRASFAGRSSLKTWFFAIVKNVAAELQRTQKRQAFLNLRIFRPTGHNVEAERHTDDETALTLVYRDESSRQLSAALKRLSLRQREVLHLVFYAEMTLAEVAETLGISLGSSRTHYHRGKERLAELLELEGSHHE